MDSVLINILCYKLPGDVSRAVHNEYESRWSEIKHIWEYPHNRYKLLESYSSTVQHLLAMSTFYRRVLSGMDGACDFYKTITKDSTSERSIAIGSYRLDKAEYNKMLNIHITFRKLRERYGIEENFFEYAETEKFLDNCKDLYLSHAKPTPSGSGSAPIEDFPF